MIRMHFSWKNKEGRMRKVAKGKAVLELNIPPLQDYSMSPCKQNCELPPPTAFV